MLLRRQPDQDLARACRVVGRLDQGLHAAQEVTEDPGPHQGQEAESRDRTRHDAPTDEGYEDLLPGFPTGLGRAMERQKDCRQKQEDLRPHRERQPERDGGEGLEGTARTQTWQQQAAHRQERGMPVPFSRDQGILRDIIQEEGAEADQARQECPVPPTSPGHKQDAEPDHQGGVEGIVSGRVAPAKRLSQQIVEVNLTRELGAEHIAIRQLARIPELGEHGEVLGVILPGPREVTGKPGQDQEGAPESDQRRDHPAQQCSGNPVLRRVGGTELGPAVIRGGKVGEGWS